MFEVAPFPEASSILDMAERWSDPTLLLLIKQKLRPGYRKISTFEAWLRSSFQLYQSEERLTEEAERFWKRTGEDMSQHSHWRGHGIFVDEARWQALGREHLALYQEFAPLLGASSPLGRIVEWGCGGGANAVHFASLTSEYVGIDICEASLEECARQVAGVGQENFVPILIEASDPEEALRRVTGACDLFLSTYVFESFPTPEYGARVLHIASRILRPGGVAIIQVKYQTADWSSLPKRFGYRRNFTTMTTYRIDEFWNVAWEAGFEPKAVRLVPTQPLNGNGEYAYFILTKRDALSE
jgi:SAM-dependent methyltransferase